MAKFEEIFGIPKDHTLRLASQRLGYSDENWTHEEYDRQGRLVARYKSWDCLSLGRSHRSGWRKLSVDGKILEEHNDLPL